MHVVVDVKYQYKGHTMGAMTTRLNLSSNSRSEAKEEIEKRTGKDIEIIEMKVVG